MEADGPSVTLPESVPPTEDAYSEPEPEPSATSEPKPAATSEPQPEPGLPQTPEESLREAPVFQTLRVVVYDVERGSSADSEDVENIDINAPLTEVIAEIEEQLGSDELFAEDIKSITIYNDSERSTPRLTAARDEFVDTSLAELGLNDGMSVGITTFQYAQQMTRRYGAAYGGDRPAAANRPFGDFTEGDGAGDDTQPVALPLELAEPGTVGGKHRVPSTRVYDFRRCSAGVLPQGAAVIDPAAEAATEAKPELEEQNDKSMALVLKKGQFVELDLDPDPPYRCATSEPWVAAGLASKGTRPRARPWPGMHVAAREAPRPPPAPGAAPRPVFAARSSRSSPPAACYRASAGPPPVTCMQCMGTVPVSPSSA
jgi:hypothetical protein